ncbi:hypothetical protein HMPREF1318_0566 [Actinomyces massiliensis F0489]|uniref:Uncharacterized protein n=1 Tax=Actinomyces massiliensis F0489 TaxID=1125718 RepID=J1H790_9ACTO|nr:hypothetical protein HMPREF1318_0566 [Actinomyces massiliensis F0489]
MADHRLRRLSSSVEIGRTPRRDRSGSGSRSVAFRVEIGRTPCRHQFTAGHHPARAGAFASDAAVHRARHVHRASFG